MVCEPGGERRRPLEGFASTGAERRSYRSLRTRQRIPSRPAAGPGRQRPSSRSASACPHVRSARHIPMAATLGPPYRAASDGITCRIRPLIASARCPRSRRGHSRSAHAVQQRQHVTRKAFVREPLLHVPRPGGSHLAAQRFVGQQANQAIRQRLAIVLPNEESGPAILPRPRRPHRPPPLHKARRATSPRDRRGQSLRPGSASRTPRRCDRTPIRSASLTKPGEDHARADAERARLLLQPVDVVAVADEHQPGVRHGLQHRRPRVEQLVVALVALARDIRATTSTACAPISGAFTSVAETRASCSGDSASGHGTIGPMPGCIAATRLAVKAELATRRAAPWSTAVVVGGSGRHASMP